MESLAYVLSWIEAGFFFIEMTLVKASNPGVGIACTSWFSPLSEGITHFTQVFDDGDLSANDIVYHFLECLVEMPGNLSGLWFS